MAETFRLMARFKGSLFGLPGADSRCFRASAWSPRLDASRPLFSEASHSFSACGICMALAFKEWKSGEKRILFALLIIVCQSLLSFRVRKR